MAFDDAVLVPSKKIKTFFYIFITYPPLTFKPSKVHTILLTCSYKNKNKKGIYCRCYLSNVSALQLLQQCLIPKLSPRLLINTILMCSVCPILIKLIGMVNRSGSSFFCRSFTNVFVQISE